MEKGVFVTEQYVNSSQVKVSFGVSDDDWCLIQQSETWNRLQNFLEETKNKHSQMSMREKAKLLEGGAGQKRRAGGERAEEIDELIEALAKHIKEQLIFNENGIAEKTKALAELISARTNGY